MTIAMIGMKMATMSSDMADAPRQMMRYMRAPRAKVAAEPGCNLARGRAAYKAPMGTAIEGHLAAGGMRGRST